MPDDRGGGGSDRASVIAGDGGDRCERNRGGGPHGGETNDDLLPGRVLGERSVRGAARISWSSDSAASSVTGSHVAPRAGQRCGRVPSGLHRRGEGSLSWGDLLGYGWVLGARVGLPGAVELAAETAFGPMQANPERGRGLAEHRCRLGRPQAVPGDQRDRLAVVRRQASRARPPPGRQAPRPRIVRWRCHPARSRRRRSAPRRRDPRCWVAITFRATARSHGSESAGTSSSRRQATRNVLATTSSDVSPGARRRAYAATARW